MYDNENNVIRREYIAIDAHGWKQWGNNEPIVKLVVNGYGHSAEQNLTLEEVEHVIEMLQAAAAQALAASDHDTQNDGWDDMPF
jgi:hypothetical protein